MKNRPEETEMSFDKKNTENSMDAPYKERGSVKDCFCELKAEQGLGMKVIVRKQILLRD